MPDDNNILDSVTRAGLKAHEWLGKNTGFTNALTGAGIGGLLSGGASFLSRSSDGESPSERRRRILRDALVGSTFGAGVGYALPTAVEAFATAGPPKSEADKSLDKLHQQFKPDTLLGGWSGSALGGTTMLAGNRLLALRAAAKDHMREIGAQAAKWRAGWSEARRAFEAWQNNNPYA